MQGPKKVSYETENEEQQIDQSPETTDLKALVSNYLNEAETQQRLKEQLQGAIHEELANMSLVLRHAIRGWVEKEKKKYNFEQMQQQNLMLEEKVASISDQKNDLIKENSKLKRDMELREHENKLILLSLKQLNQKSN